MTSKAADTLTIAVDEDTSVSGLLHLPANACACFVMAHGAGAGMQHPFMGQIAAGLGERRIGTLRYQFPYMQKGSRRPDPPKVCHATVRAAVTTAVRLAPSLPILAGGRSFGGRMTSQAQAAAPLPGVRGLVFLGFPLHPARQPSDTRAEHLGSVQIPMLLLQGTRDELAVLELLQPVVRRLGDRATLKLFADADHSFHVPARSGRNDAEVRNEILDTMAAWTESIL